MLDRTAVAVLGSVMLCGGAVPPAAAAVSQAALLPVKAETPATATEARAVDAALRGALAGQGLPSVDEGALQRLREVLPDPCSDAACLSNVCGLVGADVLVGGRLRRVGEAFTVQLWIYDRRRQQPGDLQLATGERRCAGCNISRLGAAAEGLLVRLLGGRAALAAPAQLTIRSQPAGAAVHLDGTLIGRTEVSLGVSPGEHALTLSKAGFSDETRRVRVAPGARRTVSLALRRSNARWRGWSWLKWTLAGTAAASLGAGIAMWAVGRDDSPGGSGVETRATDFRAPGVTLTIAGALLAGGAAAGFWLDRRAAASAAGATVTFAPGGALVGYTGVLR